MDRRRGGSGNDLWSKIIDISCRRQGVCCEGQDRYINEKAKKTEKKKTGEAYERKNRTAGKRTDPGSGKRVLRNLP